jgi:hypothetical protein
MRNDEKKPTDNRSASISGRGKKLPRDSAGYMDLPPETGAIKGMVGLDGFLEIYTVHGTYRVKTPDRLDPKRTVPNMPWSQSLHSPVGASNPIVARIVIQLADALGSWPLRNGNREAIKQYLHACKEETLICEAAYNRLKVHYDAAVACMGEGRLKTERNVVECPSIPTLRGEASLFLASAKRSLQCVGEIFNQFYVPDGKSPMVKNGNFEFAVTRLENSQPVNQKIIDCLRDVVPFTKHMVDLRNGFEHPTDTDRTLIEDFRLSPEGIIPPSWQRGTLADNRPVIAEMRAFLDFIIGFCETVFFFGLMDDLSPNLPLRLAVEPVPVHEIDPERPVRYRLTALLPSSEQSAEQP